MHPAPSIVEGKEGGCGDKLDQLFKYLADFAGKFESWWTLIDADGLLLSSAVLIVVILLRKALSGFAVRTMDFIASRIQITLGDAVKDAIEPALRALIIALAFYGVLEALHLPGILDQTLERIVVSVAVAATFAAAFVLVDVSVAWIVPAKDQVHGLQMSWLTKILKAATLIIALSAVLKVWDIDLGPVLTGMGVLGAGVALAAQDLFRNLIAGMASMGEKRFDIGDWVRVEGVVEGIVEKMELRSTLIRQFDRAAVHVPNADLANSVLINFTRRPYRRIYWDIKLVYDTSAEQLNQIRSETEKYIDESNDFASPDRASRYIRIDAFDESSINIMIWCFTNTIDYATYLEAKERLLLEIKRIVEEAGSSFAFPTRTILAENPSATAETERDLQQR
ncbi:MscS family inner membrane protein YnaI [Roseibium alexandrii]|uniref:MscS family inner membrane protein YnaI n=1 Tax=Roseibium alexandrii TaxID=388408 RepID=A0A0M7AR54_9HYPH|nr:MscS family inner membrane protein YnaI [Roseibium alexandrii]